MFRSHLEILYMSRGQQEYRVNEEVYTLQAGEALWFYPGEMHASLENYEERGRLYWLILQSTHVRSLLGLRPERSRLLLSCLLRKDAPRKIFPGNQGKKILEKVFGLASDLEEKKEDQKLTRFRLEQQLINFLDYLVEVRFRPESFELYHTGTMLNITRYIREHLEEELSLEHLAGLSGLSLSHFKRRFKKEIGVPPKDYIHREKIKCSRSLLQKPGTSVTRISAELGYSSSQYFSKVFKKYAGCTPTEYRSRYV